MKTPTEEQRRLYVAGLRGWDWDDVILFGLLAAALAGGIAGLVGLLI